MVPIYLGHPVFVNFKKYLPFPYTVLVNVISCNAGPCTLKETVETVEK